jgi:hypothetical protein
MPREGVADCNECIQETGDWVLLKPREVTSDGLFGLRLESRFGQGEYHHLGGVLRVFSFLIMNESVFQ